MIKPREVQVQTLVFGESDQISSPALKATNPGKICSLWD